MISDVCSRAIQDSLQNRRALLKFISANDVGLTGAHQYGFYLPKEAWRLFSPQGPVRGENHKHEATITWHDSRQTKSTITWYGEGSRSEYRLTGFGRDFPHRSKDYVGNLLVLVPTSEHAFNAYVLDTDDDIAEIQAALGAEITKSWAVYDEGAAPSETEDACLKRHFDILVEAVSQLPMGVIFSNATRTALLDCVPTFVKQGIDDQLLRLVREEYNLYRMVEQKVFLKDVTQEFKSIDSFLSVAQRILQSRKSRAGRSFEDHVEYLLSREDIPFQMRQTLDNTSTDLIIPGKMQYDDPSFPLDKLTMVGMKRTCKDRWRQVLREAPRIKRKHILTLQEGISANQMNEMMEAQVTLIVPQSLHKEYPTERQDQILSVDEFITQVKAKLGSA